MPSKKSEAGTDDLVIPSDLTELSAADLQELHTRAVAEFDGVYQDGQGLSPDDLTALNDLAEIVETLAQELEVRAAAQMERDAAAQSLAARIKPPTDEVDEGDAAEAVTSDEAVAESGESGESEIVLEQPAEVLDVEQPEAIAASGKKELRVNLSGVRSRQRGSLPARDREAPKKMSDIVYAADVPGFSAGEGLDWSGIGRAVDRRLTAFNLGQYESAARAGRHIREQHGVAVIRKPIDPSLRVSSNDINHVEEVIARAVDQTRLPGGSLVASGGWCAPSEILYDFLELETRDGMVSVPEIGISRGGIQITQGIDYSDIYASTGFDYTEAEDAAGDYDGAGGGSKPCFTVPCPTFTEYRLDLVGLCLTAGLLQSRGYPEIIARVTRGSLVAHDHRINAKTLAGIEAGSTPVTMTPAQEGATAPLLDAIELQVTHYRYVHRLSMNQTLEAKFPKFVQAVVRSDLSRRQGVDMLSVSDQQVNGWFAQRGVVPQFVYDWQDITGEADSFVQWPTEVKFLLYVAGTWVKGTSDVITLDTIYDSVLLGTNDYTALFTEEGMLLAKRFPDSRVVTVPLSPTGATHSGLVIAADGTAAAAV